MTSSGGTNQLVEIALKDWKELRDLFLVNWPHHILGYSIVNNYIEWTEKSEGRQIANLKVLSVDGDWRRDGTFIVIDRYQLFLYSITEDEECPGVTRLETALDLLDWSQGFKVSSFSSKHRRSVVRVVESRRLEREFDSETIFYHLPKEQAQDLILEIPVDVTIRPLLDEDVPLAESLWPNRHSGSLFFLRRLCKWSPNLGAYLKSPDGHEELMGWCFVLQSGALGALQVRPEFQGRRLGRLITAAMAKLLSEQGKDTFGFVGPTNTPSCKVFEGLGFKEIDRIYWLRTFPVGKTESVWTGDSLEDL